MATLEELREKLVAVEAGGQRLLDIKAELIDSDRERNRLREGLRALKQQEAAPRAEGLWPTSSGAEREVWVMQHAGMALRVSRAQATEMIEKRQAEQEAHTAALREEQKAVTAALNDKGGVTGIGDGLLKAMINLKDTS
mmetsp:Transcript_19083/g.49887  ORF Transcript_19083/g.49887 Transcript_19083/m.49887 type:complete len:139 (+) Transcript_19083:211-627(+)